MDMWLDAMAQYLNASEYLNALRTYVDENCHCFVDVKAGEFGLAQNDVFQVRVLVCEPSLGLLRVCTSAVQADIEY